MSVFWQAASTSVPLQLVLVVTVVLWAKLGLASATAANRIPTVTDLIPASYLVDPTGGNLLRTSND
jgi:hypothetical protein